MVALGVHGSVPMKHVATTKDGIVVRAHIDQSLGLGETLATGRIDAPVDKVWAALAALDQYQALMPYMRESRVVKRSATHRWQYCRTDTPVVSDRDYTLRFTMTKGDHSKPWVIHFTQDNAAGPATIPGVVRLSIVTGSWELKSVQGGRATQATYRLKTNPGGAVPLWLAHLGNKRAIPDIIRAVRKRLKSSIR